MRIPMYTKYRPHTFEDVSEQKEVIDILLNQLNTNNIRNCYLFAGPSGCGKTTIARIFANEINKGANGLTEMDAASNNGVDDVRLVLEKSNYQALDAEYRIFLLDEVHMFSTGAWNAMLKTLEEPPKKTIFMMCTTDPQKIPDTIINRVQRFDLTKISYEGIVRRLTHIIEEEKKEDPELTVSSEVIDYISKLANGGMRDAVSMLDKCLSLTNKLDLVQAVKTLGSINYETMFDLFFAMYNCDEKKVIEIVDNVYNAGRDLKLFIKQFTNFLADICKYKLFNNFDYVRIPKLYKEQMERCKNSDNEVLKTLLDKVNELNSKIKYESQVLPVVETELLLLSRE